METEDWNVYGVGILCGIEDFISNVISEGFISMGSNWHHHFLCVLSIVQADLCPWQDFSTSPCDRNLRSTVIQCWGFLNQCLLLYVAHSLLAQPSAGRLATTEVTRKKVLSARHPRALPFTGLAPVTGIVGEKESGTRKPVFTERWALKMEK